jgi:hypothetical protein
VVRLAGLVGPGADGVDDVAGRGMLVDGVVGGGGLHLVDGVDGVGERAEGWNADRVGSVAGGEILVDGVAVERSVLVDHGESHGSNVVVSWIWVVS